MLLHKFCIFDYVLAFLTVRRLIWYRGSGKEGSCIMLHRNSTTTVILLAALPPISCGSKNSTK